MTGPLTFVTSNAIKFQVAAEKLQPYGLVIKQHPMELVEIQSSSGEDIALFKVDQAYAQLQQPVIISDDTWDVPALNGFPGAYMKDLNQWLTPNDFLRLIQPLKDRRVYLTQHIAYKDESGHHYFSHQIAGRLLDDIRGKVVGQAKPFNTLVSFDGGQHSSAELINSGETSIPTTTRTAWDDLGDWLTTQYT